MIVSQKKREIDNELTARLMRCRSRYDRVYTLRNDIAWHRAFVGYLKHARKDTWRAEKQLTETTKRYRAAMRAYGAELKDFRDCAEKAFQKNKRPHIDCRYMIWTAPPFEIN